MCEHLSVDLRPVASRFSPNLRVAAISLRSAPRSSGLGQEVECAKLECPDSRFDVAVRCDDRDGHPRTMRLDPLDEV